MVHMVLACVSVSFLIFHVSPLSPVTVVHVECQPSHFHGPISPCDVSLIFFFGIAIAGNAYVLSWDQSCKIFEHFFDSSLV